MWAASGSKLDLQYRWLERGLTWHSYRCCCILAMRQIVKQSFQSFALFLQVVMSCLKVVRIIQGHTWWLRSIQKHAQLWPHHAGPGSQPYRLWPWSWMFVLGHPLPSACSQLSPAQDSQSLMEPPSKTDPSSKLSPCRCHSFTQFLN